jgi:effector-binding domain-containing protein
MLEERRQMIETPYIAQLEAAPTAVIHLQIPREKMPEVFGPAIEEIMATLAAQGIVPTGPVFAHHLSMEPSVWDFEIGLPVATAIMPSGRVQPSERPPARVARTVYYGPYEGLPEAWGQFHAWVEEGGYAFAADVWESYIDGPHSTPDSSRWRTELNRPLAE